jgi:hypothetical protein
LSYSDDYASPAQPFSGDETGQIFDAPDVIPQPWTSTERVVDTQSGFLVVVRHLPSSIVLSARRRLGTPPTSSVVLTPDESLKLSQVLLAPPTFTGKKALRVHHSFSAAEKVIPEISYPSRLRQSESMVEPTPGGGEDEDISAADLSELGWAHRRLLRRKRKAYPNERTKLVILISCTLMIVLVACLIFTMKNKSSESVQLSDQTKSLALTDSALKDQILKIVRIDQRSVSARQKDVDVYGELTDSKATNVHPVHFQIRVLADPSGILSIEKLTKFANNN